MYRSRPPPVGAPLPPAPSFAPPISACPVGGPPTSPHGPCLACPSASLLPCASPFARPHLWGTPPFFRPHPRLRAQGARAKGGGCPTRRRGEWGSFAPPLCANGGGGPKGLLGRAPSRAAPRLRANGGGGAKGGGSCPAVPRLCILFTREHVNRGGGGAKGRGRTFPRPLCTQTGVGAKEGGHAPKVGAGKGGGTREEAGRGAC